MEWIKPNTKIDFMRLKNICLLISAMVALTGIVSLIAKGGPKYGVELAGGILVQVNFNKNVSIDKLREMLNEAEVGESLVQRIGERDEYIIRTGKSTADLNEISSRIEKIFTKSFSKEDYDIRRVEMVGPQVAKDLQIKALKAILYSMIGILLYVAWRFQFRFALGAILALAHDPIIIIGMFSIFNIEFTLPVVAALLTIIGYSINDTIVVFDRIRDNLKTKRREKLNNIINMSINETLSRTMITALTVLFVSLAFFFFGGEVIHDFALVFVLGIFIGTYSSIFIASPVITWWPEKRFSLKSAPVLNKKATK